MKIRGLYSRQNINKYSDKEIVEGLRNKDKNIYDFIYREYYRLLLQNVIKGGISNEEVAKDIFQDAIIILWDKLQNGKLELKRKFITYFLGVCRNLLMKHLDREYMKFNEDEINFDQLPNETEELVSELFPFNESEYQNQAEIEFCIFTKHFVKLNDDCKRVLKLSYAGASFEEIAKKMGYKYGYIAKNKKYRCKKYLLNSIRKDKMFHLINID